MDENKKKFALWIHPSAIDKVDRLYQLDNCRSRSEFIEKAVLFYAGYVSAEDCREYFPEAIVSTIQGSLDTFENRMASLLFKYAVELAMMMHVSAANFRVDEDIEDFLDSLTPEQQRKATIHLNLLWAQREGAKLNGRA